MSICPIYQLGSGPIVADDKLNKASFKERCNLIREALGSLYAGLLNDEAVAFHLELVSAFFETFTFVLLKRIQPLSAELEGGKKVVPEADFAFAMSQVDKIINIPVHDFIHNYEKFKSKVQNARNIRVKIP